MSSGVSATPVRRRGSVSRGSPAVKRVPMPVSRVLPASSIGHSPQRPRTRLISPAAPPNARDELGDIALEASAAQGGDRVRRRKVSIGADPYSEASYPDSPLRYLCDASPIATASPPNSVTPATAASTEEDSHPSSAGSSSDVDGDAFESESSCRHSADGSDGEEAGSHTGREGEEDGEVHDTASSMVCEQDDVSSSGSSRQLPASTNDSLLESPPFSSQVPSLACSSAETDVPHAPSPGLVLELDLPPTYWPALASPLEANEDTFCSSRPTTHCLTQVNSQPAQPSCAIGSGSSGALALWSHDTMHLAHSHSRPHRHLLQPSTRSAFDLTDSFANGDADEAERRKRRRLITTTAASPARKSMHPSASMSHLHHAGSGGGAIHTQHRSAFVHAASASDLRAAVPYTFSAAVALGHTSECDGGSARIASLIHTATASDCGSERERLRTRAHCADTGLTIGAVRVHPMPTSGASGSAANSTPATSPAQHQHQQPHVTTQHVSTPPPSSSTSSASAASSSPSPVPPPAALAATFLPVTPVPYLRSVSDQSATTSVSRVLPLLYGFPTEELGHRTFGHACVSREELFAASAAHHDLLYGEVLPVGATKLFDRAHLDLRAARSVCDLGSGLGKLAMQAFLQYPNLTRVFGCELSRSRWTKSAEAVQQLGRTRQEFRRSCRQAQKAQRRATQMRTGAGYVQSDSDSDVEEQKSGCVVSSAIASAPRLPLVTFHSSRTAASVSSKVDSVVYTETVASTAASIASLTSSTSSSAAACTIDPTWMSLSAFEAFLTQDANSKSVGGGDADEVTTAVSCTPPPHHTHGLDRDSIGTGLTRSTSLSNAFAVASTRTLELQCRNLFEMTDAFEADVVICETKFTEENYPTLCAFLLQFKPHCRLLTYENLDYCFHRVYGDVSQKEATRDEETVTEGPASRDTAGKVRHGHTTEIDSSSRTNSPLAPVARRTRSLHAVGPSASSVATASEPAATSRSQAAREQKRKRDPATTAAIPTTGARKSAPTTAPNVATPNESDSSSVASPGASSLTPACSPDSISSLSVAASSPVPLSSLSVTSSLAVAANNSIVSSSSPAAQLHCPPHPLNPFKQMPINLSKQDRFYTTWATNLGHHFFLWEHLPTAAHAAAAGRR